MPSQTQFLNACLGRVGAARITAIDDGSTNANHCLDVYEATVKAALRSHTWDFADKYAQLELDVATPLLQFAYQYTLPFDFVRLVQYIGFLTTSVDQDPLIVTADPTLPVRQSWKVQGRKILSNDSQAAIEYIRYVENPNEWDAGFYEMMVPWMASKLAYCIPKDSVMAANLISEAINLGLPMAAAVESQEGPSESYVSDDLVWGRNL